MALFNDAAGLLFTVKANTDDARSDFKKFRQEVKETTDAAGAGSTPLEKLAHAAGFSGSEFAAMAGPIGIAAAAITGLAAAAAAGVSALFELAKASAEYGDQIYDTAQKTNVSTDAIQAWNFAAEQSGSSTEVVNKSLAKFSTLLGQAANDNEKAQKILEKYHITATDTDEALQQAIKTITSYTDANKQNAAAAELFKDKSGDVINIIREMGGDLPGTIQKLRDLGIMMSEKDVAAAAAFNDKMDLLGKQLAGVGRTIGSEVIPVFMQMATDISNWLAKNPGEIQTWAKIFKASLQGVISTIKLAEISIEGLVDAYSTLIQSAALIKNLGLDASTGLGALLGTFAERSADRAKRTAALFDPATYRSGPAAPATAAGGGPRTVSDDEKAEAEKRRKEREEQAKKDAAAVLRIGANVLDTLNDQFQKAYDKLLEGLNSDGNVDAFKTKVNEVIDWYNSTWLDNAVKLDKLEIAAKKKGGATKNEMALLEQEQQNRQIEMLDRITKIRKAADTAEVKQVKETQQEKDKVRKEEEKRTKESIDAELALFKAQSETQITIKERELAQKFLSESQYARQVGQIRLEILEKERALETDANRQKILDEEIKQQKVKNTAAVSEAIEKEIKDQEKLNKEKEKELELERKRKREAFERRQVTAPGTIGGGIAGSLGVSLPSIFGDKDQILSQAEFMKKIYMDVAETAGQAVGSMVDGLAQLAATWLITGEFSAKAALSMLASIAISLATQMAYKAILEYAEGVAEIAKAASSSAIGDFAGAALHTAAAGLHFAAAKTFAVGAAIAGGAGVGLALGARAAGGAAAGRENSGAFGSSGSKKGGQRHDDESTARDPNDQTSGFSGFGRNRQSPLVEIGERISETLAPHLERNNLVMGEAADAFRSFSNKFDGVPADHVLMTGTNSTRGQNAVAVANTKANSRGGRTSERAARAAGEVR